VLVSSVVANCVWVSSLFFLVDFSTEKTECPSQQKLLFNQSHENSIKTEKDLIKKLQYLPKESKPEINSNTENRKGLCSNFHFLNKPVIDCQEDTVGKIHIMSICLERPTGTCSNGDNANSSQMWVWGYGFSVFECTKISSSNNNSESNYQWMAIALYGEVFENHCVLKEGNNPSQIVRGIEVIDPFVNVFISPIPSKRSFEFYVSTEAVEILKNNKTIICESIQKSLEDNKKGKSDDD